MDIGQKIRQLRTQNDLTLEELASRSELTKGFLSQVERNLTSPSVSTLEDILEALGTDLASFLKTVRKTRSYLKRKIISLMSMRNIVFTGSCPTHRKMKWSRSCWKFPRREAVRNLIRMTVRNSAMCWKAESRW